MPGQNYPDNWPQSTQVYVIQQVDAQSAAGATPVIPESPFGTVHVLTLTANATLTFPAAVLGKSFYLALKQDATGSRLVTWPSNVKWTAATAPTLTTTAGKTDLIEFICLDGANWYPTGAPILNM